ncbi:MAG: hypothetical protein ACR2NV_13095 [Thermoleophilaceae bacterium]
MPLPRRALRRRGIPERLLAWLYTGPLGHLYSVVVDVAVLFARLILARARRSVPHGRRR